MKEATYLAFGDDLGEADADDAGEVEVLLCEGIESHVELFEADAELLVVLEPEVNELPVCASQW